MEAILVGLVWLLIYAVLIGLVCYIVARLLAIFFPRADAYGWVIWAIGGLVLLIFAVRLLGSVIPSPP